MWFLSYESGQTDILITICRTHPNGKVTTQSEKQSSKESNIHTY